jgi:hypothetical protein
VADMTIAMPKIQIKMNAIINMDQNHLRAKEAEKDNR